MSLNRAACTTFTLASIFFVPPAFAQSPAPASRPSAPVAPAQTAPAAPAVPFRPVSHIEKRGTGPIPMILVPGLACDWTVFESFMARNADRYTMYAVTLPGFGGSTPPEFPPQDVYDLWLDNAAQAVWKVAADNHLSKPVVAGHSLGGHIAFRVGEAHPNEIGGVIAIDGTPCFYLGAEVPPEQRILAAMRMRDNYEQATDREWIDSQRQFFSGMVSDPTRGVQIADMAVKTPKEITIEYLVELFAADARPGLGKITAPVLVIPSIPPVGDLRSTTPEAMRQQWRDTMKNAPAAKIVFFEDTLHFIQDDRPRELDAAIDDFLHGREPKGIAATQPAQPAATRPSP